jgi:hypothetical protein
LPPSTSTTRSPPWGASETDESDGRARSNSPGCRQGSHAKLTTGSQAPSETGVSRRPADHHRFHPPAGGRQRPWPTNPERQDREELSIVGFDGIEETTWTTPALTTVEQPIAQIADTAVQTLQTLIEQPTRPLPNSYFRPVLRVRGSTAAPAKTSAARRPVSAARRS